MGFLATKKELIEIYNKDKWLSRERVERAYLADITEFSKYVPKGSAVLDHGCDRGYASHLLAQEGFKVTGYDFNPTAIMAALEKYGKEGIEFGKKDLTNLPGKPKFDAVFSRNVLTDFARVGKLEAGIKQLYKITKKGGIVYVTAFIIIPEFDWGGKPKTFTEDGIRKQFEKYFEIVDCRVEETKTEKGVKKRLVLVGRKM